MAYDLKKMMVVVTMLSTLLLIAFSAPRVYELTLISRSPEAAVEVQYPIATSTLSATTSEAEVPIVHKQLIPTTTIKAIVSQKIETSPNPSLSTPHLETREQISVPKIHPPPTLAVPAVNRKEVTQSASSQQVYVSTSTHPLPPPNPYGDGLLDPEQIRERTNLERQAEGLSPLRKSAVLATIAEAKARDMLARQYFAHESPTGVDIEGLSKTYGYDYLNVGENLALGNFTSSAHVVTSWMGSPGHRANIVNTHYTEIGISAIEGIYEGSQVWVAVQEFGRPRSDCPEPDQLLKQKITIYNEQLVHLEKTLSGINEQLTDPAIDPSARNALAKDYNTIVALYNSIVALSKNAINVFNTQAEVFNACIGSSPVI